MDTAYKNAVARQDILAKRINKLQAALDMFRAEKEKVDNFLAVWAEFSKSPPQVDLPRFSDDGDTMEFKSWPLKARIAVRPATPPTLKNSKKEEVAAATRDLIAKAGKPLLREDLFPLLRERGLVIQGNDPQMVLSTMLWRMRDKAGIVRLKGGGYWLADRPWEPANYVPFLVHLEGQQPMFVDVGSDEDGEGAVDHAPPSAESIFDDDDENEKPQP